MASKKNNAKQTIRSRDEWEWHATGDGGGHWVRRVSHSCCYSLRHFS